MRNFLLALIFLFTFFDSNSQNLESDIQAIADDYGVMGMSLYVNGNVSNISIGLRDFERDLPVTEDTQYRIASVSKSFTALGLIKLINDSAIGIDDDITEVMGYTIRNPNFPSTLITPRMLLSHTSGLKDGSGYGTFFNATNNQDPIPNISKLITKEGDYYTSNMWRLEPPGTYFAYSNINFGLIGTLIEVASKQRFDVFMKNEILMPLNIDGSFNIQDLEDINNLSVLYRYNGGWNPQWDNYQGITPIAPNLTNYSPGTNGDNYGGLFNRWGLGLHHANTTSGDVICPSFSESFIGHPGEAYGLVSDNYFIEGNDISFSLLINGVQQGYQIGNSSFYTIEEDIFGAVCTHINQLLNLDKQDITPFTLSPNPASNKVIISVENFSLASEIILLDTTGKTIKQFTLEEENELELAVNTLTTGIYFIQLVTEENKSTKKLIVE